MAGFNINKYQWEALYQANPVILDLKLSHPDHTSQWYVIFVIM